MKYLKISGETYSIPINELISKFVTPFEMEAQAKPITPAKC